MINFKLFNNVLFKLTALSREIKQLILIFIDSFLIISILLMSFSIRLGYWYWPNSDLVWVIFGSPLIAVPVFISFKLYRSVLRYIGLDALTSIAQAVTLYSVIWGLFGYIAAIEGIPRSVIIINWLLALLIIGSSRILARLLFTSQDLINSPNKSKVIIYGAGAAGRQLSHALQLSEQYHHVAYIDDDKDKENTYFNNIPVFPFKEINALIKKNQVTELLLALPSISRKKKNQIIENLNELPVHVRSLPSLSKIAEGKVKIDDLLEIEISDLLGREPVKPNQKLLKTNISSKVVLVTGAGGSIGSELCRQIIKLKPLKIVLFEISEPSLYQIEQELLQFDGSNSIVSVLGSVRDKNRLSKVLKHFKVNTIYHAAAYKHVPLVEYNQSEGVLNNSIGTLSLTEAAIENNVETFVLISTDKAVRPTNAMGASKRIAELILQAFAKQNNNTCFSIVRFGNVLDSSGSVIPTFKKQIKMGGPITVTDKNIVRYFMTIPEAVELVIQAGAMGKGGDVFVLDMGEPVLIRDLAVKMIQLSGLTVLNEKNPDGDIAIEYTGLRPGEKLFEELLFGQDVSKTQNKLIMSAKEQMIEWKILKPAIDQLQHYAIQSDQKKIRDLLLEILPEFNPQNEIKDFLYDKNK
jgi:FlaA1/EpsC-like NDP-sugar epimerase